MVNYVLRVKPMNVHVTPYGFYIFARDYYNVAEKAILINFHKRINYPAYFLYCRSIELVVKAVLLASKRVTINQIKTHDFCKLLPKLDSKLEKILMLNKADKNVLLLVDKWYKTDQKKFEYFSLEPIYLQPQNLPDLYEIKRIAAKMLGSQVLKFII